MLNAFLRRAPTSARLRPSLVLSCVALPVALAGCGEDGSSSGGAPIVETPLLELGLLHHPAPLPEGGFPDLGAAGESRVFVNDGGQSVELSAGELSLASIELVPCPESVGRVTRDHSGGEDGVTLLFEATDDIVGGADVVARTKTYEVSAHSYCDVILTLAPTTLFGDERPTFSFAGTCSDGTGSRAFEIASQGSIEKELTITARNAIGEIVPTPLDPTTDDFARAEDDDAVPDLLFGLTYPALFSGIDCVGASDAELLAHVTGRIAGSALHQHNGGIRGFESF